MAGGFYKGGCYGGHSDGLHQFTKASTQLEAFLAMCAYSLPGQRKQLLLWGWVIMIAPSIQPNFRGSYFLVFRLPVEPLIYTIYQRWQYLLFTLYYYLVVKTFFHHSGFDLFPADNSRS